MKVDKNLLKILSELYEGVYIIDEKRNIVFWNKAAENITGYKSEEVLGKSCKDNILKHVDKHGKELCIASCPMVYAMENNAVVSDEVYLHHKDGFRLLVRVRGIPIIDDKSNARYVIELFNPVFSHSEEDDDLLNLAFKDPLTKVYNRKGFEFLYNIRQMERSFFSLNIGVLFFDIDNFKKINDTYGHELGDKILYAVAQIFAKSLRSDDLVVRWGGEEFIVIIFVKDLNDINVIGNKLTKLVESSFVEYNRHIIKFTVSGGGTFLKPNETILEAIKRADELMYKSKIQGKNRFTSDI